MASKYMQKFAIPDQFPDILHDFTREILRYKPKDILEFGVKYFESILNDEDIAQFYEIQEAKNVDTKAAYNSKPVQNEQVQNKPVQKELIKSEPIQSEPKQIIQEEKQVIREEKTIEPVVQNKKEEKEIKKQQSQQSRPESSQSKATSHKTEKQISDVYLSKLYSENAQNISKQSIPKDNSIQSFPCGTLYVQIHQFNKEEKFAEAEKVYVLAFPTTNSSSIYKTQEISHTHIFSFEEKSNFYFENSHLDEEMEEPSIIFQVYLSDAVKQQLGQAIIPISQFINKEIYNQQFPLYNQSQQTNSFIQVTLKWEENKEEEQIQKSESGNQIEKKEKEEVVIQQEEQSQQEQQ